MRSGDGDGYLKRSALSCPPYKAHVPYIVGHPEMHQHRIRPQCDQFLLLVSDGTAAGPFADNPCNVSDEWWGRSAICKPFQFQCPVACAVHGLVGADELVQWAYYYILSARPLADLPQHLLDRILRQRVCVPFVLNHSGPSVSAELPWTAYRVG